MKTTQFSFSFHAITDTCCTDKVELMGRKYKKPVKSLSCLQRNAILKLSDSGAKPGSKSSEKQPSMGRLSKMASDLREPEDEWKMPSLGGRVAVRLTIPLLSADHVKDAAAVFQALADTLSETAASETKTMHKLFDARWAIMSAQRRLKGGRAHFRGAR